MIWYENSISDSYIYALYSPKPHRMHEEGKETRNSEIWAFDWEGESIRKILADTQIECFCVDEADTTFYCVLAAPDYCIGKVSCWNDNISIKIYRGIDKWNN